MMKVGDIEGMAGRSFPGRARAAKEVDLAFRVTGPLVALPVNIGDEVKEGDLVARIDPRDFEVALRNAEGALQRSRATLNRSKLDLERMEGLQKRNSGAISEIDVDQAREAVDVADADVDAFVASVDAAKDALEYTNLRAPFSGTIVATYVENFQNVRQQQMVVRLVDTTRIEFEVGIPETLISLASYIAEIRVTYDAHPDEAVPAELWEIGREASSTTRTFPVTVIMDQPKGFKILPGMAGRVEGTPKIPKDLGGIRMVVPVTSVFTFEGDGLSYVWVVDEGSQTVSRQQVELGKLTSSGYVIKGGLEVGDTIATAGVNFLKEGQQVNPVIQ